ncbi:hypothetical protein ACFLTY_02005 [Chloroflexota bacterium]
MVNNIAQPSVPLPSIFSKIAGLLKNHYDGKTTSELHFDLPSDIVSHGEKWVRSLGLGRMTASVRLFKNSNS